MALHTDIVIRSHLREVGGSTVGEIAEALDLSRDRVTACLKSMVDVYIDRYVDNPCEVSRRMHKYLAVYELAQIPENCPHPKGEKR